MTTAAAAAGLFDFYLCRKCRRLCTALEMAPALGQNPTRTCCPCGGLSYIPTNLPLWGWLLPRVWTFAWHRWRELGVAGLLANRRVDRLRDLLQVDAPETLQFYATYEVSGPHGSMTPGPRIAAPSEAAAKLLVQVLFAGTPGATLVFGGAEVKR
jgi:hypothetical protein